MRYIKKDTKGILINIEGLSGTGKSTIAELLTSEINAKLERTVPEKFSELRKLIDQSKSINARFCFYLSAVFYSIDNIEKNLGLGKNVVVESYFYRTIAFHRGMGSELDIIIPENVLKPTLNIYLECDPKELEKRKKSRVKEINYWTRLSDNNEYEIYKEYSKYKEQMFTIDSTALSPVEIVQKIVDHINKI